MSGCLQLCKQQSVTACICYLGIASVDLHSESENFPGEPVYDFKMPEGIKRGQALLARHGVISSRTGQFLIAALQDGALALVQYSVRLMWSRMLPLSWLASLHAHTCESVLCSRRFCRRLLHMVPLKCCSQQL